MMWGKGFQSVKAGLTLLPEHAFMVVRVYQAYSDWVIGGLLRFREKQFQRQMRKGRMTEEMAQLYRDMFDDLKPVVPILFGLLFFMVFLFVGFLSRLIPYSADWMMPVMLIQLPIAIWQIKVSIRYLKPAKRLRRAAILDGRIKARFPDRIWAWRQRRAIVS